MTISNQDLTIYAGDDFVFHVGLGATKADGTPLVLTGGSATWAAKPEAVPGVPAKGGSASLTKSTANGGVVLTQDAAGAWIVQVTIGRNDTANLSPNTYYHETEIVTAEGKGSTVATGRLTIKPTVIRA